MTCLRVTWLPGLFFLALCQLLYAVNPVPPDSRFGFTGPEIFPIENGLTHLRVADLDGDGLKDILVVNNNESRINLLLNQTGKTNRTAEVLTRSFRELNELPPDARFRIESLASEKRISSFLVEDLNSDCRPDIAYYGEPKELVLLLNNGTNGWLSPRRFPIGDGQLAMNALGAGDLNGDHRTDLVLLGENEVLVLYQNEDRVLGEPERIPFSGLARSVQVIDIDGDHRQDLLLVNWDDLNPFRFRLQLENGRLGPEVYFSAAPIRSYWADTLEPGGRTQLITIAQNSGRAQVSEFRLKPAEPLGAGFHEGQFQVLPLKRTAKAKRGILWSDVNGDGLEDLLVAEPENGQMSLSLQQPDGSLASAHVFPTLAGITEIAAADWDGDRQIELFLLSSDERQIGVTTLDANGRLPFPTLVPLEGKPLVMTVGRLQPDAKPTLAVIIDQDGRRSLTLRQADGKTLERKLRDDYRSTPSTLALHDADQDGLADLVVLTPYEKIKILRPLADRGGDGSSPADFAEIDVSPPGGAIEQPWLGQADVDGDGKSELLLTQKNFVRAVVLKSETRPGLSQASWAFSVKDQINGQAGNSRLAGAVAVPGPSNNIPALFLLDVEQKALTLCQRDSAGVWKATRNLQLPVSDFNGLEAVALQSTNANAVSFIGLNTVALLPFGGQTWDLVELDGYETPIKEGRLTDVVSGDLDNDGRKDLVFLETGRNYLDLVVFDSEHKLVPANRWQVFEERTFQARRSALPEPREAVVDDVTGDGKNDLVVLVHDRILVYPQEQ